MPETSAPESATYRHIEIRDLDPDGLVALSNDMKLSLSREDMLVIQSYYAADMRREPTDVELEVIAQTWSEHCKHRIFGARIEHTCDGEDEVVIVKPENGLDGSMATQPDCRKRSS